MPAEGDHISRWEGAWARPVDAPGRIGWHKKDVHSALIKHWEKFLQGKGSRVFVPLCGKTVDMPFLASKGLEVVGVEAVQQAIDEFMQEHPDIPLKPAPSLGSYAVFTAHNLSIYRGDYFKFSPEAAGMFDLVFDRASLQAIDPSLRQKYADVLTNVVSKDGRVLLVTLDYDQSLKSGPPFSVPQEEVESLYKSRFTVEHLESRDILETMPRFKEAGVQSLQEVTLLLTRL